MLPIPKSMEIDRRGAAAPPFEFHNSRNSLYEKPEKHEEFAF